MSPMFTGRVVMQLDSIFIKIRALFVQKFSWEDYWKLLNLELKDLIFKPTSYNSMGNWFHAVTKKFLYAFWLFQ